MEISKKFNVEIKVLTKEIENGYLAFRKEKYINNSFVSAKEGIVTKEELNKISETGDFVESKYYLVEKEIYNIHRRMLRNSEYFKIVCALSEDNPYSAIQIKNSINKYTLLCHLASSEDFIDTKGEYLPKALYFNYLSGDINNSNYNLEEMLKYLKTKDNIVLLCDSIVEIPYYNQEPGQTHSLRFIFTPTKEEYNKYKDLDLLFRQDEAIKIIGLERFKKSKD